MKLADMKKVGYWVTSSWNEAQNETLKKSLRKLRPNVESLVFETYMESSETNFIGIVDRNDDDTNENVFLNILKQITVKITKVDVTIWLGPTNDEQDLTE